MALTKGDKNYISSLLEQKLTEKLDDQEQKFEAKLTEFRDDFYTKIDPEKIHPKDKHSFATN